MIYPIYLCSSIYICYIVLYRPLDHNTLASTARREAKQRVVQVCLGIEYLPVRPLLDVLAVLHQVSNI